MIVISAALLFAAIVLLVLGVFAVQMLALVYASIIASVLAAILLGLGAFLQRDELLRRSGEMAGGEDRDRDNSEEQSRQGEKSPAMAGGGSSSSAGVDGGTGASNSATRTTPRQRTGGSAAANAPVVPDDAVVFVVPGRPYYHLTSCRQLGKREKSEQSYRQARDRGYTPCRACLPDTALAARAGAHNGAGGASADEADDDDHRTATATSASETAGDTADNTANAENAADERADTERSPAGEADRSGDSSADPGDSPRAGLVGVVQGSNRYHRLTCAVVEDAVQDGIELTTMSVDEAEAEGATRCTVCRP